jgi:hypothetical protein
LLSSVDAAFSSEHNNTYVEFYVFPFMERCVFAFVEFIVESEFYVHA